MPIKWIGAVLVILSCSGCGFSMAAACKREEAMLVRLLHILEFMESELEYRQTPLPTLCRLAGENAGNLKRVLDHLARELESQISPNAACCMDAALAQCRDLPRSVRSLFEQLGSCLGCFDLNGQMRELEAVRHHCEQALEQLRLHQNQRIRTYQTLGICAGIALAILLI